MAKRNNKSGEITFPEKSRTNSGNTNKKSTQSTDNAKLLTTINSLNNTLDKNFKALSNALKDFSKSKGNNKNTEVDKLELEREKALTAHQLKIQTLQEKILKQRIQQANENHKRYINKNYGEGIGSVPSKIYSNIKGQGSNAGSALALSLMTGGIINPVIAKEFGLDKIVTASAKFAGRTVSKATSAAWNMTGGLAWNNLKQPFVDPDSRLRQGLARGSNKASNIFSNKWFGLLNKDNEIESDGKQAGAVAKDKDKLSKIEKNTADLVKIASKPKEEREKQDKKEKKSLLDKIFEAIGGMGLILKGAAVAAIPYVIKEFLPKATEWLDEKFKSFLNGTIGLSESSTEGVSQLVKDALPGALFGMTVGGFKGALIGAGLSIGINWVLDKIDEFKNDVNKDGEEPAKIGPFTKSQFEAVILGMSLGSLKGFKGMLIGGIVGYTVDTLASWGTEAINTIKAIKNGDISGLDAAAEIGKMVGVSGSLVLAAIYGFKLGGIKGMLAAVAAVAATDLITDVVAQAVGPDEDLSKISGEERNERGKRLAIKNALKQAKETGKSSPLLEMYKQSDPELVKEISGIIEKEENKGFFAKAWDKVTFNNEDVGDYKGAVAKKGEIKKEESKLVPEKQSGGYGTLGPIGKSADGIIHGIKATGLKDMSLKGSVVSSNSIPYIATQNEQSLKALDDTLNSWGYEVIYTSAMGGHKPGTGHWKGNKVDLQLKKNGKPTHLSGQQLNMLGQAGYWGRGTGALGWEPVSGQVGGGHYDLYIGGSNSGTALASAANMKLETNDMPTSQESQVFAMNEMNETAQASAENTANSNDSILGMLDSMNTNIASGNSISGMGNIGQAIDISMPSTPGISVSSNMTQGGGGSQTGNVYAFGDVAKTPILYTL